MKKKRKKMEMGVYANAGFYIYMITYSFVSGFLSSLFLFGIDNSQLVGFYSFLIISIVLNNRTIISDCKDISTKLD